jgi:23S rRNA (uracil1939-C5)-methyltransferase
MARRRKRSLPLTPVPAQIENLSHDGRGVAHIDGKAVFIDGALPGEQVMIRYVHKSRHHDEAMVDEVLQPSAERVEPACAAFGRCGGCSLQHLSHQGQLEARQQVLLDNLQRLGNVEPDELLPALTGPTLGYRRKARLGVRYVRKKQKVMIGFREKRSAFITEIDSCPVLHPAVGARISDLAALIGSLSVMEHIPQIEIAVTEDVTALVIRHLQALTEQDRDKLSAFERQHDVTFWLQAQGPESITPLNHDRVLQYRHDDSDVSLQFLPADFTQVNFSINEQMVKLAIALLEPAATDNILDLFCGIGNFTLPLSRHCARITGVEGDADLVARANANATRNNISNARFLTADLEQDFASQSFQDHYDKVLLDPPRSGARNIVEQMHQLSPERITYVSCNSGTLARDAGILAEQGYRLQKAGIMDMFPHTAHFESIALFVKR